MVMIILISPVSIICGITTHTANTITKSSNFNPCNPLFFFFSSLIFKIIFFVDFFKAPNIGGIALIMVSTTARPIVKRICFGPKETDNLVPSLNFCT